MKIPEPRQLPSGMWRVQVMVDGRRYDRVFAEKDDAIYWATGIKLGKAEAAKPASSLSVDSACDRYITAKESVLSPSTVLGYKRLKKNCLSKIGSVRLCDLTQERVQRWVNSLAKELSPKSVRNAHGLLTAILADYRPEMVLRTTLPRKEAKEVSIPEPKEIEKILKAAKGTRSELPIVLAIWLGLRQSEIRGLRWSSVKGDYIRIDRAVVDGENGPAEKATKTIAGTREIEIPPEIKKLLDAQPKKGDYIVALSGQQIYKDFVIVCETAGVRHFRFHDLRHANASVMLALGIPNKYSARRIGHSGDEMLKKVYQHTIKAEEQKYDRQIDEYFQTMLQRE